MRFGKKGRGELAFGALDATMELLPPGIARPRERGTMRLGAGVALGLALLLGGCGMLGGAGRCPRPVAYDDQTLKDVQKALAALPKDSVLRQVMADYEQ